MAWWAIIPEWPLKFHVNPLAFNFYLVIACFYRLLSHKEVKSVPLALKPFSTIQRAYSSSVQLKSVTRSLFTWRRTRRGWARETCQPDEDINKWNVDKGRERRWRWGWLELVQSSSQSYERKYSSLSLPPLFNHLSPSLSLISSAHPTLPQSPCQKSTRDKRNIWQSATLPTAHPSSINVSLLLHSRLPLNGCCTLHLAFSRLWHICARSGLKHDGASAAVQKSTHPSRKKLMDFISILVFFCSAPLENASNYSIY